MLEVRIAFASLAAPLIATLPYLAFAYYGLTSFAAEGGAPAQGVLTGAFLVLIGGASRRALLGACSRAMEEKVDGGSTALVRLAHRIRRAVFAAFCSARLAGRTKDVLHCFTYCWH